MTTKTNRRPEYTDDNAMRIISAPGGLWQVQHAVNNANTREAVLAWVGTGRPLSYEEARAVVGRRLTEQPHSARRKLRSANRASPFHHRRYRR